MKRFITTNEYLVLIYRMTLMMIIYSMCRVGFYLFNSDLFGNVDFDGFLIIMRGGWMFDISALLYLNLLYLVLFLLPFRFKFSSWYRSLLKWVFIVTNAVGLVANVSDFIYYRFTLRRTTFNVFETFQNEENLLQLWGRFIIDYWYAAFFWVFMVTLMVLLYGRLRSKPFNFASGWWYTPVALVFMVLFSGLTIVGMRGGYKHSTRPITMSNAGKFVNSPEEMALVINTPFSMLRTIGKTTFKPVHYFSEEEVEAIYSPVYAPPVETDKKPMNVVIFILESFNRENSGYLNPHLDNGNYKGYMPFLDSLMQHSYVFTQAFANGRKSIDAMPSVLASLPALVQPFILSEYSSNKINGMGSLLKEMGYHTSFFHGAPNGSMGFDAFAKMAGFDSYYGKSEYNNDEDFDGIWGVWDEPFFQFFGEKLNTFEEPFVSAIFSVSSHHPFKVPEKYEGVFPKGTLPIHQCIGYTDMALRKFFAEVKTEDWYENTLFIITADHSVPSHYPEYKTNINGFAVPLFFYTPNSALLGIDNEPAQQTDILPTVMNLVGYPEGYVAFGNNLMAVDKAKDRFVMNFANESYQFIKGDYVYYFDGHEIVAFYNYKEDIFLKNNLKNKVEPSEGSFKLMEAFIQQYINRMVENKLTVN